MAAHDAILFPLSVQSGVSAVEYATSVVDLGNAREQRIAHWLDGRVTFDAALGLRSLKDLRALLAFFRARKGRARSFLVRDLLDYEVGPGAEGIFGEGDGVETVFQLTKTYSDAYNADVRPIAKPEASTVQIYRDATLLTAGVDYTLDAATGLVTFTSAPVADAILSWTGQFFVPVRFAEDTLPADQIFYVYETVPAGAEWKPTNASGPIPPVKLIEVFGE